MAGAVPGEDFSLDKVRKELEVAVAADSTYTRVNDMKKRAISTAATYDEFKGLVACAQDGLKPVTNKELQEDLLHPTTKAEKRAVGTEDRLVEAEATVRAGASSRPRFGRKRKTDS
jgi:predicted  nucleic acid-binding Zn-ribbon protein